MSGIPRALQLEKKPSGRHQSHRTGGGGGGMGRGHDRHGGDGDPGGGGLRAFRATLLRGERGISIQFGKFVALISISGEN